MSNIICVGNITPPLNLSEILASGLNISRIKKFHAKACTVAFLSAVASFSSPAFADITFGPGVSLSEPDQNGWVEIIGDGQDSTSWHDATFNLITVSGANNTETITSPLRINHKPLISHSQFSIQAANGGTLNIDGDLDFNVTANQISPHFDTQIGTYALYATGQSHLNLNGSNIFVEIRHNLSNVEDQLTSVGANGIYLNSQSTASVGQKEEQQESGY